jgi:hypothetical protein
MLLLWGCDSDKKKKDGIGDCVKILGHGAGRHFSYVLHSARQQNCDLSRVYALRLN